MSSKLSDSLKEVEALDLDKPSIEEICKKSDPLLWQFFTFSMWGIFCIFVGVSVFNNFKNSEAAKSILSRNQEVPARVMDIIQILEGGKYTDYSVDLELDKGDTTYVFNLDIPEEEFEGKYKNLKAIPIIFDSENDFNLKSHYVGRSNILSNWIGIIIGYIIVFVILYTVRHLLIKLTFRGG